MTGCFACIIPQMQLIDIGVNLTGSAFSRDLEAVVERARMLDQENIIDIKACQTMMRVLDIGQNELPSFIEQVPFAPAEIERLQNQQGFTRL